MRSNESQFLKIARDVDLHIDKTHARLMRGVERSVRQNNVCLNTSHLAKLVSYNSGIDYSIVRRVLKETFVVMMHYLRKGFFVDIFRFGSICLKYSDRFSHIARLNRKNWDEDMLSMPRPRLHFEKNQQIQLVVSRNPDILDLSDFSDAAKIKRIEILQRDLKAAQEVISKLLYIEKTKDGKVYRLRSREEAKRNPKGR